MESSPWVPHWLLHDIWNWTSELYQLLPERLSSQEVFANSCFGHTRRIPCSLWTGTLYCPSFLGGFSSLPFSILPPNSFNDISSYCNHRGQEASARKHCLLMCEVSFPWWIGKLGRETAVLTWWDCVAHSALQPRWFQTPPCQTPSHSEITSDPPHKPLPLYCSGALLLAAPVGCWWQ